MERAALVVWLHVLAVCQLISQHALLASLVYNWLMVHVCPVQINVQLALMENVPLVSQIIVLTQLASVF